MASSSSVNQPPYAGRPSPIRYRVVSAIVVRTARWISFSDANPGRLYDACYRARDGGCGYYHFVDDRLPEFQGQIIVDMRDEIYRLNAKLKAEKGKLNELKDKLESEMGRLDDALRKNCAQEYVEHELRTELKEKEEEIELLKGEVMNLRRNKDVVKFGSMMLVLVVCNYFWVGKF